MTKEQYQEEQSALDCQDQVKTVSGLVSMPVTVLAEQPPPNSHAHFRLNWAKFIGHFVSNLVQPSNIESCPHMCPLQRVETSVSGNIFNQQWSNIFCPNQTSSMQD